MEGEGEGFCKDGIYRGVGLGWVHWKSLLTSKLTLVRSGPFGSEGIGSGVQVGVLNNPICSVTCSIVCELCMLEIILLIIVCYSL